MSIIGKKVHAATVEYGLITGVVLDSVIHYITVGDGYQSKMQCTKYLIECDHKPDTNAKGKLILLQVTNIIKVC